MGSAHAKPLLPMGCKADTLGTGLSGLSSESRGTAEAGGPLPWPEKTCPQKMSRASLPALQCYLGVHCTPPSLLRAGELWRGSHVCHVTLAWSLHRPCGLVPRTSLEEVSCSRLCRRFAACSRVLRERLAVLLCTLGREGGKNWGQSGPLCPSVCPPERWSEEF